MAYKGSLFVFEVMAIFLQIVLEMNLPLKTKEENIHGLESKVLL